MKKARRTRIFRENRSPSQGESKTSKYYFEKSNEQKKNHAYPCIGISGGYYPAESMTCGQGLLFEKFSTVAGMERSPAAGRSRQKKRTRQERAEKKYRPLLGARCEVSQRRSAANDVKKSKTGARDGNGDK